MRTRIVRFTTPALRGVHLNTLECGDPSLPTLVLLHGGGANLHWWDHVTPLLAEHSHVVALDFRGHGDSDYPEALEVGAFDRDLEALVAHLANPPVVLVGHSLGGHVALHHAARSDRVRAVVAIEVTRGAGPGERRRTRLALAATRGYRTRQDAIDRFRFVPSAEGAPEGLRRAVAEHSVRQLPDGRFGFKFDPRWFSLPPLDPPPLAEITCPTLIVRGMASTLLSAEGAVQFAEAIPHCHTLELPGAGHNVHIERPDAVLEAIREHLDDHS